MKRKTLKDVLYNQFLSNSFFTGVFSRLPEEVIEYYSLDSSFYTHECRRMMAKYGNKPVGELINYYIEEDLFYVNDEDPRHTVYQDLPTDIAFHFHDKWLNIFNVLTAEYNPIENYDRTEDTTVTDNGDITNTYGERVDTIGSQTHTKGQQIDTYGEQQNTIGEQQNTQGQQQNVSGQQENIDGGRTITYGDKATQYGQKSDTVGAQTTTTEHQTSAYNSQTYQPESKDIVTSGERTDVSGAHTDTELEHTESTNDKTDTIGERTDTIGERQDTIGQRQDTIGSHDITSGSRSDTDGQRIDTKGEQSDTVHNEGEHTTEGRIHGNIGVTTTQQMIESEILLRSKYKLFDIIEKDIAGEITLKIYD